MQLEMTKCEITTPTDKIKMVIKNYFSNLYAKIFEELEDLDRFIDIYELSELKQEDFKPLNNPIMDSGIEVVIKILLRSKRPYLDGFLAQFPKLIMNHVKQTLPKFLMKLEDKYISK